MQIKSIEFINDLIYINNEIAHGVYIDNNSNMYWYKDGKLHRDNDRPSIIYKCNTRCWCKNGVFHRENDQPAVVYSNGDKLWYYRGEYHRDNGKPAVIHSDGDKRWYKYGTRQFPNKE